MATASPVALQQSYNDLMRAAGNWNDIRLMTMRKTPASGTHMTSSVGLTSGTPVNMDNIHTYGCGVGTANTNEVFSKFLEVGSPEAAQQSAFMIGQQWAACNLRDQGSAAGASSFVVDGSGSLSFNYGFFPVVYTQTSTGQSVSAGAPSSAQVAGNMNATVVPFIAIVSNQPMDGFDTNYRMLGQDPLGHNFHMDAAFCGKDLSSQLSVASALLATIGNSWKDRNVYVTIQPYISDGDIRDRLQAAQSRSKAIGLEAGNVFGFTGSSLGLAVALAAMGGARVMATGYLSSLGQDQVATDGTVMGLARVLAGANMVESVEQIHLKVLSAAINDIPIVIPLNTTFRGSPIMNALLGIGNAVLSYKRRNSAGQMMSHESKYAKYLASTGVTGPAAVQAAIESSSLGAMWTMSNAIYTSQDLQQGNGFADHGSLILAATSLGDALALTSVASIHIALGNWLTSRRAGDTVGTIATTGLDAAVKVAKKKLVAQATGSKGRKKKKTAAGRKTPKATKASLKKQAAAAKKQATVDKNIMNILSSMNASVRSDPIAVGGGDIGTSYTTPAMSSPAPPQPQQPLPASPGKVRPLSAVQQRRLAEKEAKEAASKVKGPLVQMREKTEEEGGKTAGILNISRLSRENALAQLGMFEGAEDIYAAAPSRPNVLAFKQRIAQQQGQQQQFQQPQFQKPRLPQAAATDIPEEFEE